MVVRNFVGSFVWLLFIGTTVAQESNIGWPAYGGADGGGHYSAAAQITPENVGQLERAWVHRSGDFREGAGFEAYGEGAGVPSSAFVGTPILVRDTLYYCTPFNRVFALDPQTGEERWVFDPKVDMSKQDLTNCRAVSSWIDDSAPDAVCGHRILLGTLDARVIALDGKTGQRCADFGVNGELDVTHGLGESSPGEYSLTSPAAVMGDAFYIGGRIVDSIHVDVPAGVVRAYSVRTGQLLWAWNPVAPGMAEVDADGNFVTGTTNVWSIISVDPQRNLVIVPTGNTSSDYYGGHRKDDIDYYSSSVVALDGSTGKVVWNYQTVHHDIWDFDVPAQPTLVDLTINGEMRPAVVQVTKMGMTFVLDRETGQPLFPVEERPVPQTGAVAGEYLAPTQPFPTKPEPLHQLGISPDDAWGFTFWDKGECRDQLEAMTTGPIYTPLTEKGLPMYPSTLGGQNWGNPAVDPERQIMVADTRHVAMVLKLIKRENCTGKEFAPQEGTPYCVAIRPFLSSWGAPCTKPPWATLAAVDLKTGDILWQEPLGTLKHQAPWPISYMAGGIAMGGPSVTKSGLIFYSGSADRHVRAYDINSGAELWGEELPTSGNSVPMTYVSGGNQYVIISAGGHSSTISPPADYVIAYRLPNRE